MFEPRIRGSHTKNKPLGRLSEEVRVTLTGEEHLALLRMARASGELTVTNTIRLALRRLHEELTSAEADQKHVANG